MERFCLGVVLGALLACWLPALPTPVATMLLILSWSPGGRRFALVSGVACFLAVLSWQQQQMIRQQQQLRGQDNTEICFSVQSLPRQFAESVQFVAQLLPDCDGTVQPGAGLSLQLSGDSAAAGQPILAGQHWQATIRLKSYYGTDNFGLPERARQLLSQGISGRAVFSQPKLLDAKLSYRQLLAQRMAACCAQFRSLPLWLALTLGERPFTDELWYGVQASGLAHLLSISGMHISWLFGVVILLAHWLIPQVRQRPWLMRAVTLLALALAFGYAMLAGMAVPTQRAVWSLALVLLLQLLHRRYSIWQFGWLLSGLMLLSWPYWLFSYSYWLSVLALAVLALLNWRYPPKPGIWQLLLQFCRFQYGFSLLLLPVTLLLFGGVAPLALPVNLLVVPLVTLLMMPVLALLFVVVLAGLPVPMWLAQGLDLLSWPLYWVLTQLAEPQYWWAWPDVPWPACVLLMLAALLVWMPLGWQRLWAGTLLLPLYFSMVRPAEPVLFVLDIGQGSSAVLQYGREALVIDLGPAFGAWSATEQTLLPFLRSRGISQLSTVVLSHDDSDHTGAWPLFRAHYPVATLVSDIRRFAPRFDCGRHWQINNLSVRTFRPSRYEPEPANESSCAVLLSYQGQQILLPGDIGRRELQVADWSGPVQVLVLGHHGSKHASSLAFLQQIKPAIAIASAGLQNRFGHPAQSTLTRLSMLQSRVYSTHQHGAVRLDWRNNGWQVRTSRAGRFGPWVEKTLFPAETLGLNR
jgi:competence protein ComEC